MEFDIFENINVSNLKDDCIQEDNFEEVIDYDTIQKAFFDNKNQEFKELLSNKHYNSNEFLLKNKVNLKLNKLKLLLYQ